MNCIGGLKSCDLAMNRTLRRIEAPRKKWSMNEKWLGARITGPLARHVLGVDAAHAEERPRVERGGDADDLVDDVGLARARALVEAIEVLRGPRVLVDLRPDQRRPTALLVVASRRRVLAHGAERYRRAT